MGNKKKTFTPTEIAIIVVALTINILAITGVIKPTFKNIPEPSPIVLPPGSSIGTNSSLNWSNIEQIRSSTVFVRTKENVVVAVYPDIYGYSVEIVSPEHLDRISDLVIGN